MARKKCSGSELLLCTSVTVGALLLLCAWASLQSLLPCSAGVPLLQSLHPRRLLDGEVSSSKTSRASSLCELTEGTIKQKLAPLVLISNRLLWCPNPKAGTTTVWAILQDTLFPETDSPPTRCYNDCSPMFHGILDSAWEAFSTPTGLKPCNVKSLIIVRNPWDRVLSAYREKIATGKINIRDAFPITRKPGKLMIEHIPTFKEFVEYIGNGNQLRNPHWKPYSSQCFTEGYQYDTVLRIEDKDFNQKLHDVFRSVGLNASLITTRHSTKGSASRRDRLLMRFEAYANDTEMINIVQDAYGDDIKRFGYTFGEFGSRA